MPLPAFSSYAAAKHGVVGLMRVYANLLAGQMIRVNSIHPSGVETPMINNLRSIAACLRNDLDDPVEVAASVDPTSRSHALFSQLADAIEEENERKRVFHSAQRTQVVAAKRFEDASSAVQEIELQIRKLATGEQA